MRMREGDRDRQRKEEQGRLKIISNIWMANNSSFPLDCSLLLNFLHVSSHICCWQALPFLLSTIIFHLVYTGWSERTRRRNHPKLLLLLLRFDSRSVEDHLLHFNKTSHFHSSWTKCSTHIHLLLSFPNPTEFRVLLSQKKACNMVYSSPTDS